MKTNVYLNFKNQSEEALKFYHSILGGNLDISYFGQYEDQLPGPVSQENKNLVMHGCLSLPNGDLIMATDAPEDMGFKLNPGNNIYISLNFQPTELEQATKIFNELSQDGSIEMPFGPVFWGDTYGSLQDKFSSK
jgi:PhnB protein